MTEPGQGFHTTMRIDIAPQLREAAAPAQPKAPVMIGRPHPTVIRIPARRGDVVAIGGPDFQELLQHIYDAVIVTTLDGRIVNANFRALQFLQYTSDKLCGVNVMELVSGADPGLVDQIQHNLENDRYVLIQAYLTRMEGSIFPAEVAVNHLQLSGQRYLSFFIRDITLRKEAEEQLRTGYNAIQNSGNGIAIVDNVGVLEFCNPAMLRLWGVTNVADLAGMHLRDFLADPQQFEVIRAEVDHGMTWESELTIRRTDGSFLDVHASLAANFNTDGNLTGMVISMLDITAQKEAQRQLENYARQMAEKNTQMENDLAMAREVQQAFMPREFPAFRHDEPGRSTRLRFSHVYIPSGTLGGDFFDVVPLGPTRAGVFIADVMGHGMRAALVVAALRGLLEQLAPVANDPGQFLTALNRNYNSIFGQINEVVFATAVYLILDTQSGALAYGCAGHPFPIWLQRSQGRILEMTVPSNIHGPALGLFEEAAYTTLHHELTPGDAVILYTDGLSESNHRDLEYYSSGRMFGLLNTHLDMPLPQLLEEMVHDACIFSGVAEFLDDVCLLGVEYTAEPGAAPAAGPAA